MATTALAWALGAAQREPRDERHQQDAGRNAEEDRAAEHHKAGKACGDRHEAPHSANLFDLQAKYAEVIGEEQAITFLQGYASSIS